MPDPNAESTFLDSKLDWDEPEQEPHATLLRVHRELIALRRAWPELSDPWLDDVEVDVRRRRAHRGAAPRPAPGGVQPRRRRRSRLDLQAPIERILLASEPVEGDAAALTLPPESFAVAQLGPPAQ